MAKGNSNDQVSFWQMVRDVLIVSMNKGQFPVALIGMVFIVMLFKMPGADVSKLMFEILDDLKRGYLAGYGLGSATTIGWFFHAKKQRSMFANEMKRITAERNKIQEAKIGSKLKSSGKGK